MQGVNLKMGTNYFSKESTIMDLKRQLSDAKEQLEKYQEENTVLRKNQKEYDRIIFEFKNTLSVLQIERSQNEQKIYSLNNQIEEQNDNIKKLTKLNQELQSKLRFQLDKCDEQEIEKKNLQCSSEKFQLELQQNEKRNMQLEKIIQVLNEEKEEHMKQIALQEKNLQQKDRHVAILVKERDRQQDFKENIDKDLKQKQKKHDYKEQKQQKEEPSNETEKQIQQLKQQNMDLIVRLRNKKLN